MSTGDPSPEPPGHTDASHGDPELRPKAVLSTLRFSSTAGRKHTLLSNPDAEHRASCWEVQVLEALGFPKDDTLFRVRTKETPPLNPWGH